MLSARLTLARTLIVDGGTANVEHKMGAGETVRRNGNCCDATRLKTACSEQ